MPRSDLVPSAEVWLEKHGKPVVGRREAQVLEGLRKFGSLFATARALGISYYHAWESLSRLNEALGTPVVEVRRGGKSGGGAKLTRAGLDALSSYKRLERSVSSVVHVRSGLEASKARLFTPRPSIPDFTVIGSDCPGIRIILRLMRKRRAFRYDYVTVGSSGGLTGIMLGEADVAGLHLFDEGTGTFNLPFLRRYWLDSRAVLVRGYVREQGLMIAKGNPGQIGGVEDLSKSGVRFINRTLGSGTRTLLDLLLKQVASKRGEEVADLCAKIKGYEDEVRTHAEVAEAVSHGNADAGFGIAPAGYQRTMDFIPVFREDFDFAIDEGKLSRPLVKLFLNVLRSGAFEKEIEAKAVCLSVTRETGKVIYRPVH